MRTMFTTVCFAISAVLPLAATAQSETVRVSTPASEAEDLIVNDRRKPAKLNGTVQARPISLLFTSMDANRDKLVSRVEVESALPAEWKSLQPSFNNKVSALKLTAWAKATLGSADSLPSRLSFDSNLDNQVSEEEFVTRILSDFDRMDEDDDGQLSRAELVFVSAPRIVRDENRRQERQRREPRQQERRRF